MFNQQSTWSIELEISGAIFHDYLAIYEAITLQNEHISLKSFSYVI